MILSNRNIFFCVEIDPKTIRVRRKIIFHLRLVFFEKKMNKSRERVNFEKSIMDFL